MSTALSSLAGGAAVTQTMHVTNSLVGQKPLAMRLRVQFEVEDIMGNQKVQEIIEVTGFPSTC